MPHVTHLLDPKRGRASHTKMWTLCGEQVMTRLVFRNSAALSLDKAAIQPQCKACVLAETLEKISRWFDEFPATGDRWPDGTPVSYGAAFGSNGERDFMRDAADAALARVRGEQPDAPKA